MSLLTSPGIYEYIIIILIIITQNIFVVMATLRSPKYLRIHSVIGFALVFFLGYQHHDIKNRLEHISIIVFFVGMINSFSYILVW